MFKRGAPFQVPQIPGTRKINALQNKPVFQPVQYQNPPSNHVQLKQTLSSSQSVFDQKFCFQLDSPLQQDPTLFWKYQLTNQVSGQYLRRIIFRQMQFVSRSLSQSQIPQTIYISADNVVGYRNKNGVPTSRICALHLCQAQATLDDTDTKVYDLLYKQTQDIAWDIPFNQTELKFRINFDQVQKSGDLNIPLTCQFDIRHAGK